MYGIAYGTCTQAETMWSYFYYADPAVTCFQLIAGSVSFSTAQVFFCTFSTSQLTTRIR